jgi:hypothetical protein
MSQGPHALVKCIAVLYSRYLKKVQDVRWGGMDWIDLAEDKERSWALINVVMNLRFP